MNMWNNELSKILENINWGEYLVVVAITGLAGMGVFLGLKLGLKLAIASLKKSAIKSGQDWVNGLAEMVAKVEPITLVAIAVWAAVKQFGLTGWLNDFVWYVVLAIVAYQIIKIACLGLDWAVSRKSETESIGTQAAYRMVGQTLKGLLWVMGFLFLLSNFGVNVTSLMASLGIGGLAIALAAQSVLSDLLSSVTILIDKPFEVGDSITVGQTTGKIEKIGIRTSRIRSVTGDEVVIPNQRLTSETVQNFRRMRKRRVKFMLQVTYNTKVSKLEKIPTMLEKIVNKYDQTEFVRAKLIELGDSGLVFEIVYRMKNKDFNLYKRIQHEINMGVVREFEKEKIPHRHNRRPAPRGSQSPRFTRGGKRGRRAG